MWVPTAAFLEALVEIQAGGSVSAPLANSSIGLVRQPIAPTVNTVMANLTEANYTGYQRQASGLDTVPFVGPGGLFMSEGTRLRFMPSDTVTANTIYAAFVTGHDSTVLFGVEVFDNPIPLPGPLSAVTIVPRNGFDPAANFGMSLVSN